MKTFKINGKEYKAKAFDFNLMCDIEDMGLSISDMGKKNMSFTRAYFSLCACQGKEISGKELEQHMINGGSIDDLVSVMNEEMEKSDFFRSLNKTAETENAEDKKEEK
jgi:hypothetical protein